MNAEDQISPLQASMLELLGERGPMFPDDLRDSLCCASRQRFTSALAGLVTLHRIERGGSGAVRLKGDARPWPHSASLNAKYQRRLRAKRERAVAVDRDLGAELVEEALGVAF